MAIVERGRSYYVKVYRKATRSYEHVGSFPWAGHGGKRAAKDAALAAESVAKRKRPTTRTDETCREFAARWLEDFTTVKKGPTRGRQKSPKTIQNYRQELKVFLKDHGSLKLGEVDRQVARRFANAQPRSTVVVRNMFADAFDDRLVESNVFAGLQLPQGKGRSEYEAINATQRLELAAFSRVHGEYGPIFESYVNAAGLVGWRLEEGLNLKWSDLRPAEREVDLRVTKFDKPRTVLLLPEAWEWIRKIPRQIGGKSDDSMADGPRVAAWFVSKGMGATGTLGESGMRRLSRWRGGDDASRDAIDDLLTPTPYGLWDLPDDVWSTDPRDLGHDFVFRGKRGTPLSRGNHQTLWEPVRSAWWVSLDDSERERLVDFDFHSLRHHCAHEFYVVRGFGSELTAYQLGHSDPSLIESRYGKPWQGALDRLKRVAAGPVVQDLSVARESRRDAESA